ncbi:dTMP kinase [Allosphingosinicella flava]|uniref:Thymidylate kinase n=1 Tax=Allosphingosinicella flava TaxID=2771430 RepID=A0A7T2LMV9_9SPHN|nr:dTMP kinase [Sphingosinicella flava]QPQ55703.1 dTMP kinase [Sphingosinicella flava]
MSARGRFVTLEGGEGAGKSTQLKRLAEALRARGLEVVETREPGGSPGAEAIRALLLQGEEDKWTPEAEALLFAAARADHVAKTIKPALARGAWVLSDRFVDSSIAYQGGAGGLGKGAIRALHDFGSRGFLPDRTILLTLPAEAAAARAKARDNGATDRIGARDEAYHATVASTFAGLAEEESERFRIVDASGSIDEVAASTLAAIEDLL